MTEAVDKEEFRRLESTVHQTSQTVHELTPLIRTMVDTVQKVSQHQDDLATKVAKLEQPKGITPGTIFGVISAIIGISGIVLTAGLALGAMALAPMNATDIRLNKSIAKLQEDIAGHAVDGHPKRVEQRILSLENEVEENEKETVRERQIELNAWNQRQTEINKDLLVRLGQEKEVRENQIKDLVKLVQSKLDHLQSLITINQDDLENLDSVLQREMRLLDGILQREMGLHVDRLEDLIKTNKEAITVHLSKD